MSGEKCTLCGGAGDDKDCICGGGGTIAAQIRGMESCIQYWRDKYEAHDAALREIQRQDRRVFVEDGNTYAAIHWPSTRRIINSAFGRGRS